LWRKRQELWEKVQHFAAPLFKACPFLQAEDTAAASLSFGQKRILDFTRSVASAGGNSVLLLDEPFAGIHAEVAEVMWDMLRDLAARGASVLLVEHENEASRYNGLPRLSLSYGRVQ
jgi:ABC-type branched-subunit amino acid transport system ATPase component